MEVSALQINSGSKNKRMWQHKPFLLFTAEALHVGKHRSLYAFNHIWLPSDETMVGSKHQHREWKEMGRLKDFILYIHSVLRKNRYYLLVFSRQTTDAKILLLIPVDLRL
jgi:hypothetical protein